MYVGVRSSNDKPFDDLGIKYFSSSSDLNFISEQREYPERFKYDIINIFSTREDALKDEIELHEKYDVANNINFYNKQRQGSYGIDFEGQHHTDDAKKKIGKASKERGISEKAKANLKWHTKNRTRTEEERKKMSDSKKGNTNASGKRSNASKKNISEAKKGIESNFKGKKHSKESRQKMSDSKLGEKNPKYWKGKSRSEETIHKISENRKGKGTGKAPIVICPHCEKKGGLYAMKQWHFDNCKNKKKV